MGKPRIFYTSHSGASPEGELDALASVYALILQQRLKRQQATKHVPVLEGRNDRKRVERQQRRMP
jgi:hypothetical protein